MENLWLKAGKITNDAIEYAYNLILKERNLPLYKIADKIEKYIISKGAQPAFPVNISINEIAAHYTPSAMNNRTISEKDVVKIDIGASYKGYIGDAAFTINLSNDYDHLLKASYEALENAISVIRAGVEVCKVEKEIQDTIEKYGFKPISNLGGHQIKEYNLHAGIFVGNVFSGNKTKLEEGMIIALEPFASTGRGYVVNGQEVQIFSVVNTKGNIRLGKEIWDYIKNNYNKLPFAERWLFKKFGSKTRIALLELLKRGLIMEYPVLIEKKGSLVSQFEKTILVTKDGCEILTDWNINI